MQQAARVSDVTAFFWLGKLVDATGREKMFTAPSEKLTEDYVTEGSADVVARAATRSAFQDELEQLKARLLEMGGLAESCAPRSRGSWSGTAI